jgi:hypothetical protein
MNITNKFKAKALNSKKNFLVYAWEREKLWKAFPNRVWNEKNRANKFFFN